MNQTAAKVKIVSAMGIFGTIGLFVRYIALPSSVIAMARGVIGALFLSLVMAAGKTRPDWTAIRKNLFWLVLSGGALGANWILLFEAYRFTTVATATLCYYLAPILVVLVSPLVLGETMTGKKLGCVLVALGGMVFVSGVVETGLPSLREMRGILFGLGAAVLYACVVLLNKRIGGLSAYDKTVMQLGLAALVLLPYCMAMEDLAGLRPTPVMLGMLLFVGVIHTGLTYFLYFGSLEALNAQTIAVVSYIDPVVAVLLSALVLRESMGLTGAIGAVMILGAALVSECG